MIEKFPKLHSPFVREETDGGYYCRPMQQEGHEWVIEDAEADYTVASEKLDGTNCAIRYKGDDIGIWTHMGQNDMNEVRWLSTDRGMIVDGVLRAWRRGWIQSYADVGDALYGELIGEKIQGNPYDINGHLFVPFDYLRDKCSYDTYGKYEASYESFKKWFDTGLIPLFYARWHNMEFDEASEHCQPEGIVFYNEKTGDMSKLSYDMWNL